MYLKDVRVMIQQIGTVSLGEYPRITAVASDKDLLKGSSEAFIGSDLIEIRVDLFQHTQESYVNDVFHYASNHFSQPLIGTIRAQDEGGTAALTEEQRLSLYKMIAPYCGALDIEIKHYNLLLDIKPFITLSSCLIIGSYHNFIETPTIKKLEEVFTKGQELGFDIIKIVTMANSEEDTVKIIQFLLNLRGKSLIAFAMGSAGLLTRVVNPILGSVITYGFVSKSAAPGQLSVRELNSYLKVFDSRYK